jgi:hypothetical protein
LLQPASASILFRRCLGVSSISIWVHSPFCSCAEAAAAAGSGEFAPSFVRSLLVFLAGFLCCEFAWSVLVLSAGLSCWCSPLDFRASALRWTSVLRAPGDSCQLWSAQSLLIQVSYAWECADFLSRSRLESADFLSHRLNALIEALVFDFIATTKFGPCATWFGVCSCSFCL